jgi:hypothetical protein
MTNHSTPIFCRSGVMGDDSYLPLFSMRNILLFDMAAGKICSGAWLALLLLALTRLSTLPAAAQSRSAAAYTFTTLAG